MSQIEVKNVKFSYSKKGEKAEYALGGVSFRIDKGEFVSVVGKNGCGKSTLAKLLNGLFEPTVGKVFVCGYDTENEDTIFEIRKRAGMVFQNPDNQMVATIVEDDIAFGPENLGVPPLEIEERVKRSLETVGMTDYRYATASKLSGGQKQRIAIAGVLAMEPEILILDEATSMLDPKGRAEVMSVAKKLNDSGITVVNITHNMDEVALSDRVIALLDGFVVFDGVPKELFKNNEVLKKAKLDLPPIAKLRNMLLKKGVLVGGDTLDENTLVEEIWQSLK
ncbi:MAG: energy-coupling factor transporter ATPase [Acidaminococcus sp.]|nr:energy-coupling factor transporter ATPase [Acidaminococcus sp.]MDD7398530.1 energy-coupling factor transporter ATPase [Bacillota bacterium]MDY4559661.1 energy-coupling factor transporter ATPase [Eubacteriales bacterium]MDY5345846.1 energy-coupling factor transporter ATPase [Eubacteriales bacterium]